MLTPLLAPRHGTPKIVDDEAGFAQVITDLEKEMAQLLLMPSGHLGIAIASGRI